MVFDDGVTARVGENHFLMSTTTGGAAAVLDWLEEWIQTEWRDLRRLLTSVTTHWAAVALAGPNSRRCSRGSTSLDLERCLPVHDLPAAGSPASGARLSHQLLRRHGLRGPRAGQLRACPVAGADDRGRELQHHALRYRGDARAARREGLHHRGPGHGRHHHAPRPGHGLDRLEEEADFLGKRWPVPGGQRAAGPQAARRAC